MPRAHTPAVSAPAVPDHDGADAVGIIGASEACIALTEQVRRIARADAPVLIEGETGSGKELVARAVHYLGARRCRPFVPVNCGAIPESLAEAELFGHVRGAFTDAKTSRAGVVAHADGGTLFLDEIDALPVKGQVTLLRFLQDRRYRPVGNSAECFSDARVVAACNRPLAALATSGAFRSDLLYRLNIFYLRVPPLRERTGDITLLARHFVGLFCRRYGLEPKSLHGDTLEWMQRYAWPGNVRELENLLHRLVLLCDDDTIRYDGETAPGSRPAERCPNFQSAKAKAIATFERDYLTRVLNEANGNISAAARLACKERRSLGKLMKKHGIVREHYTV